MGVVDECGVCNGPGPTEVVIEDMTSPTTVFLPIDDEWFVLSRSDTTWDYLRSIFLEAAATCELPGPRLRHGADRRPMLVCRKPANENYENGDAIPSGLTTLVA